MPGAMTRKRTSALIAGFLAAFAGGAGSGEAQPAQLTEAYLSSQLTETHSSVTGPWRPNPVTVPIMLYRSTQLAKMSASAPQPVTCPRHTKPRIDCTPVVPR